MGEGCGEWQYDAPGEPGWKCGRLYLGTPDLCAYCQRDARHPAKREDVEALRNALADIVLWSDLHPDYPERAVVKTKYIEKADEVLRSFNARVKESTDG